MTKFLLIRHATTDTVGKRLSGRTAGVHLNETGRVQVHKLAERLAGLPIAAVYTSPLERAVQTAAPIAQSLNVQSIIKEEFIELDFGHWTNAAIEDVKDEPAFGYFNTFRSGTRIPGGEAMLEAQSRIVNGMLQLCTVHPSQTIAIVSHSDLIKAAIAYFAGIHLDLFQRIEISPASVSLIEIYPETARIIVVNDTGEIKV